MRLPTIVAGNRSSANVRPGLRGIMDEYRIMSDSPQVIVYIMTGAEGIVMAAIAYELLVLVNKKMSHVQMLMSGEAI